MMDAFEYTPESKWGYENRAKTIQILPMIIGASQWGGVDLKLLLIPNQSSGSYAPQKNIQYTLSSADMIAAIKSQLGLTIKALSELIGVSRQTLYDWTNLSHLPSAQHDMVIDRLFSLSQFWRSISSESVGRSLKSEVAPEGVSIADLVRNTNIPLKRIEKALRDVARAKELKSRRIKSLRSTSITEGLKGLIENT